MGLFRPDTEEFTEENALLTAITGKDGSFSFENIPYGHWIVKEISAPDLYTVSPQQHHVYIGADGQHIEIRVENTLIRGSVQVTKTEAVEEPSPVERRIRKTRILSCASCPVQCSTCMRIPTPTRNMILTIKRSVR